MTDPIPPNRAPSSRERRMTDQTQQTGQRTEAAARAADVRLQAALDRHAGWQLEYDIALIRADRKRLLARIADLELVPRCGATTPSAFINAEPLGPCILDHGHGGMHQEGSRGIPPIPGAQWTNDATAYTWGDFAKWTKPGHYEIPLHRDGHPAATLRIDSDEDAKHLVQVLGSLIKPRGSAVARQTVWKDDASYERDEGPFDVDESSDESSDETRPA